MRIKHVRSYRFDDDLMLNKKQKSGRLAAGEQINAFCLPGGKVVIYTDLLSNESS